MKTNNLLHRERYQLAEKRVKQLKGYYFHVLIFVIINIIIAIMNYRNLGEGESYFQWHNFFTFSIWGLFLLSHTASVFLPNMIFGKGWEARRIKKYIEKEDQKWN